MYNFKLLINLNFIINILNISFFSVCIKIKKVIIFAVIIMKEYYNKKYISKFFNLENKVTL